MDLQLQRTSTAITNSGFVLVFTLNNAWMAVILGSSICIGSCLHRSFTQTFMVKQLNSLEDVDWFLGNHGFQAMKQLHSIFFMVAAMDAGVCSSICWAFDELL
ncbi:hypothetical protein Dimus_030526 [Dionaea muscipula]